jgi:hypothetical protein
VRSRFVAPLTNRAAPRPRQQTSLWLQPPRETEKRPALTKSVVAFQFSIAQRRLLRRRRHNHRSHHGSGHHKRKPIRKAATATRTTSSIQKIPSIIVIQDASVMLLTLRRHANYADSNLRLASPPRRECAKLNIQSQTQFSREISMPACHRATRLRYPCEI